MTGWACGMYGGGERRTQGLGGEPSERVHLEDVGRDGRVILNGHCRNCLKGRGVPSSGSGQRYCTVL